MGSALQVVEKEESLNQENKTTRDRIESTLTEELFFSICSPIGSLKENAIKELKSILEEIYNYEVHILKLSSFIEEHKSNDFSSLSGETEIYSKYCFKINEGNLLREKYTNQILAELAISQVYADRAKDTKDDHLKDTNHRSRRKCYIFDSLKNKEELRLLRSVYTENFYQLSIFSPLEIRVNNLISKGFADLEAREIIKMDEFQNNETGQNVRGTFVGSDFFLRISDNSDKNKEVIHNKIERYLHLIFESKVVTPTQEETSMFYAKSAANNSSCLSRQVGASITDDKGNLLSTGWNDVPKFGGNLYRDSDVNTNDKRCFNLGHCTNDIEKDELTNNISDILIEDVEIKKIFEEDGKLNKEKFDKFKSRIRNSKVKDLIEFSRSVHAEMHAIVIGSQMTGSQMVNGKLYCTTYPCHNCARHIILSGIKEVYYIEPYVKSLCTKLHFDSITEDETDKDKVRILIFDGVSPRRYQTFFTNFADRKDKRGKLEIKDLRLAKPKTTKSLQALPELERQAIHSLKGYGLIKEE